jgi:hypothetical protein
MNQKMYLTYFLKIKIHLKLKYKGARASHVACEIGSLEMCKVLDKYNCDWDANDHE